MLFFVSIFLGLVVIFSCGMNTVAAAPGDTIYVNASGGNDSNNGSSWLYAKQSISNAISTVNPDGTINIADGQYTGSNNTGITINQNIIIQGQSEANTIINGTYTNRIFFINSGITVTINNLTLTNGTINNNCGGAIYNQGNLTINNCTLTGNTVNWSGGAIYNSGNLTITNSTLFNNTATGGYGGGAIYNEGDFGTANVYISNSTLSNNIATGSYGGGAIYNEGDFGTANVYISNSTLSNNTATGSDSAGGIFNFGSSGTANVYISNSTLSNNIETGSDSTGVIFNFGSSGTANVCISNSTLSNNIATGYDSGGTIFNEDLGKTNIYLSFNKIYGNGICSIQELLVPEYIDSPGLFDINDNWWGSNYPDFATLFNYSIKNPENWVILTVNANPNKINNGETSTITADFNHINNGSPLTGGYIPDGPITLTVPWGSLDSSGHTITENTVSGVISPVTFTANEGAINPLDDPVEVTASADGYTTSSNIYINNAPLTITKTANQTNYNTGNSVLYTIDVLNNGPDNATNVNVNDTLPSGLNFVSTTDGGVWDATTRTITWTLSSLTSGSEFIPTVTATVCPDTQGQTIINTAAASNDQIITPVTATSNIYINNASLVITKTANQTNYNTGNSVLYTIDVLNNGPDNATNVNVNDTLPSGLNFVNTTDGGVWDATTRTVTWTLSSLASGSEFIPTVTATVCPDTQGQTIINTATASNDQLNTPVTASSNIYINIPTVITVNSVAGYKGSSVELVAILTDSKNKPLMGKTINFNVNGKMVGAADTLANGKATLSYIITQNMGIYTILANFQQNSTYTACNTSSKLNVLKTILPSVIGTNPADHSVNVGVNKVIKITFNETIKAGNMWIELKNSKGTTKSFKATILGNVLSIKPNSVLADGTKYTLILHSNCITDLNGNKFVGPYQTQFTTAKTIPQVISTIPANQKTGFSRTETITIKFNENIKKGTNWSKIVMKNLTQGRRVAFTEQIKVNTLYIKMVFLRYAHNWYQITIPAAAIKDVAGNNLQAKYTFKFETKP